MAASTSSKTEAYLLGSSISLVSFFYIFRHLVGIILEKEAYAIFCKLKPFWLQNIHMTS